MLRIEGARHRFCGGISRHSFLQIDGLAMGSLTLAIILFNTAILAAGEPNHIRWSWGPVAPTAKSSRATTVVSHDVITVGGTAWDTADDERKVKRWLSSVDKLDTKTMKWDALPDYPMPVGYAVATTVGKRVFVAGGRDAQRGHAQTFFLDTSLNQPQWLPAPDLPRPRWAHTGGAIGPVIYVIGGSVGDPSQEGGTSLAPDVLALDTNQPEQGWTHVADLPSPRFEWPLGTVCGDKIFLFAGFQSAADGGMIPAMTEYVLDLETGQWRKIRSLPEQIYPGAVTSIGDQYILLCAGLGLAARPAATPDGKLRTYFSNECFLYDVRRDRYKRLTPMKQAVLDQGLVHVDGKIISTGGEESPHKSRTDLVQVGELSD